MHRGEDDCRPKSSYKITNKLVNNSNSNSVKRFNYELNVFDHLLEKDATNVDLVFVRGCTCVTYGTSCTVLQIFTQLKLWNI